LKDKHFQVHTHLVDHYSRIFTSTFPNQFVVLLVEIEGPVWYTICHHFPVKGVSSKPSINQPMGKDIYVPNISQLREAILVGGFYHLEKYESMGRIIPYILDSTIHV